MSQKFDVTASCEKGHSQTITFEGESREWVEGWAGLMDGTSPFYVKPPTDSAVIGKCGICGTPIKCEVKEAAPPPVDRSARVLSSGAPVPPDESHRELDASGQQKGYVVLSAEERAKGFVRPVRRTYTHVGKLQQFENPDHPSGETQRWKQRAGGCGSDTTMALSIAETYARDPGFYSGTFCCQCARHLPLNEFVWKGTEEQVGS